MKTGIRKPNIKKSISARTTGKVKRAVKKSVNPMYGKKGTGFVKDPAKSVKNAVYHRTTVSVSDIVKSGSGARTVATSSPTSRSSYSGTAPSLAVAPEKKKVGAASIALIVIGVLFLIGGVNGFSIAVSNGIIGLLIGGVCLYFGIRKRRNLKQ